MNIVTVEPIWQPANQQKIYRRLLDAMSYPGRIFDLIDLIGDSEAELALLACLVDEQVTYADPDGRIDEQTRRMLGSECVPPEDADFVLHDADIEPANDYTPRQGDIYRPDSSATLILRGTSVGKGIAHYTLRGPGIAYYEELCLSGFQDTWLRRRADWVSHFPEGVDIFLCDAHRVVGIPRTTQIEFA